MIKSGFDVIMRYKRVDLEGFNKHFGLNKTNRIVGYTPDFVGASRSHIVRAKNYIRDFIAENFDFICKNNSSTCVNDLISSINSPRVVYSAGYDTCTSHLKEYFKDNTTESFLNRDKVLEIVAKSNYKWFKAPVCDFSFGREIYDYVRANPDSYPGHYSSFIFGDKKMYGDEVFRNVAYILWTKIKEKPIKNLYLWKILGREKDIKLDYTPNKVKEVGTRVVMTCEGPITYLLMWMSQKLNYILGYADWDSPFNLCGEFNSKKAYKLVDHSLDYDYKLEADWSFYDSNIDTHFLQIGAALLCNGIVDSKVNNNLITTFICSVVTKYVIVPPGIVIELNRSQPSGHPAGSLINCYVNLLYWCIIGYKIYGDDYADNMRVEVYGDDTFAYFKHNPNLSKIDQYISECGLQSEPVYPNLRSTKFKPDLDKDIDFLKRRFDENIFVWNHKKMFDKWLYQSRNRNLNEQIQTVLSYVESVPTDKDLTILSSKFIEWVTRKYPDKIDRDSYKVIDSVNRLVSGEIGRIDDFKYCFGGQYRLDGYNAEINLLSFSTHRPRLVPELDKFLINTNIAKHVIIYALGVGIDELYDINISKFLGVSRSPPKHFFSQTRVLNRSSRLFRNETMRSIRIIKSRLISA